MSDYTVTVYVDASPINGVPHVWITLNGPNYGDLLTYSYGPTMLSPWWFGTVDREVIPGEHDIITHKRWDIDKNAYDAMKAKAEYILNNPYFYDFSSWYGKNCADFAKDIVNSDGQSRWDGPAFTPWLVWVPRKISQNVPSYWELAQIIRNLFDPLALDLDGNGISTISANAGITFDHNKSGVEYGTGWINPNDGWLALDRDGNGKIDSGRELFGDSTIKLDGNRALHAYDALASFDTNNDGQVSAADATGDADSSGVIDGTETYWDINRNGAYDAGTDKTFADLRVWVDAATQPGGHGNGNTDSGELKTLAELGITSIATGKTTVNTTDASGNLNTFAGDFTRNGSVVSGGARAFNLLQNTFHRVFPDNITVPPDVALLPNMQGSGAVRDLHEAMSLGTAESAALKTTVQAFSSATTRSAQYALMDQLLLQWSRTSQFDDMVSRLNNMTTTVRDANTGRVATFQYRFSLSTADFWNETALPDPFDLRDQNVDLIEKPQDPDYVYTVPADDNLYMGNATVLAGQTTTQKDKIRALAKTRVLEVFNNAQFFDFSSQSTVSGAVQDDPATPDIDEGLQNLHAQLTINSGAGSRSHSATARPVGANIVVMTEDDVPIPNSNYIHASYDQLRESVYQALALQTRLKPYMDAINITLDASGNVAFDFTALDALFASNLASDRVNAVLDMIDIVQYRGADLARSGWNVEAAFATIESTVDAIMTSGTSAEQAALAAAGFNVQYGIENDSDLGGEKNANVLTLLANTTTTGSYHTSLPGNIIIGGTASDNLIGKQGNDVMFGGAGNDGFHGDEGNDILWGGDGIDGLNGHEGNDYLFGGAGNDSHMNGGDGNDQLTGGAGNDGLIDYVGQNVFQGGAGNDTIKSGTGSDAYIYAAGDGVDTFNDRYLPAGFSGSVFGVLQLTGGILPEQVVVDRNGTQLEITFTNTSTDKIIIEGFFTNDDPYSNKNPVQSIVFDSGMIWMVDDIVEKYLTFTEGNDSISGTVQDETFHAGGGDDVVYGQDGNDVLYGEAGADQLYGGSGGDVLDGGAGNDTLKGDAGNDTFVFNLGTGSDTVNSVDSGDVVRIGPGITAANLIVSRNASQTSPDYREIVISHRNGVDKITLKGDLRKVVMDNGSVLLDEGMLKSLKDRNITLVRNLTEDRAVMLFAADLIGNSVAEAEKARWQIVDADIVTSGFGSDTNDADGDSNTTETAFFLVPNFFGSGNNLIAFMPGTVTTSAPSFSFDLLRDPLKGGDGLTFHATVQVNQQDGTTLNGTAYDDILDGEQSITAITVNGNAGEDLLRGKDDDDVLSGHDGNDVLNGNMGSDTLNGGNGDDHLGVQSEWGSDTMVGGPGSDTYHIDYLFTGWDADVIHNADPFAQTTDIDVLRVAHLDNYRELWFRQEPAGDDLLVTQLGKFATVRIEDWFSANPEARLDQLEVHKEDHSVYQFLLDSHFDALVQAMATVSAPATLADLNNSQYDSVRAAWDGLVVPQ